MRTLLAAVATLAALAAPPMASAEECLPKCTDLPAMEKELFDSEFLQALFKKYVDLDRIPKPTEPGESMIDAMQREARVGLDEFNGSPAGGGKKGASAPHAGTTEKCTLVLYVKGKPTPYDDALYRRTHACWDADSLLVHELKHVAHCRAGLEIHSDFRLYAASDVQAYGAGARKLRALIAETAGRCGWKGSTRKTKPNPVDKIDVMVVPTPAEVKEIVDALKNAPTVAGKGKR
jgi:hypothetical protein